MFSKSNKEAAAEPAVTAQPVTHVPPPVPKRAGKANGVPSILSAEVIIKGVMISMGDVQVEGKIEGDIRASSLVVGEKAVISGDVYAEEATIRGRVEGSIAALKVQLASTCRVSGNILHQSLSVESGAFFEGNCRHSDNPLADAPESVNGNRSERNERNERGEPRKPAPKIAEPASQAQPKS